MKRVISFLGYFVFFLVSLYALSHVRFFSTTATDMSETKNIAWLITTSFVLSLGYTLTSERIKRFIGNTTKKIVDKKKRGTNWVSHLYCIRVTGLYRPPGLWCLAAQIFQVTLSLLYIVSGGMSIYQISHALSLSLRRVSRLGDSGGSTHLATGSFSKGA